MARDDLVRMANQIALFFEPYPADEGTAGVAEHLKKFWDPTMRVQLVQVSTTHPEVLHPLVARAVGQLREAIAK